MLQCMFYIFFAAVNVQPCLYWHVNYLVFRQTECAFKGTPKTAQFETDA